MTDTQDTAVAKMVALLEALPISDAVSSGLTIGELSSVLVREKSVVSRQLKPLVQQLGLVERGEDGRHTLGWRLFAVAARAGDQRLLMLAPPAMRHLSQLTQESVHLSVRRGSEVFTILSESHHRSVEATGGSLERRR